MNGTEKDLLTRARNLLSQPDHWGPDNKTSRKNLGEEITEYLQAKKPNPSTIYAIAIRAGLDNYGPLHFHETSKYEEAVERFARYLLELEDSEKQLHLLHFSS